MLTALAIFASCKKSTVSNPETPAPETIKEMNIAVTELNPSSAVAVQQGTPGYNFIGYGYDITGKYADVSSVKAQAINTLAYAAAYPNDIDVSHSTSGGFNCMYAKNAEDYSSKLSMNLSASNGMNLFKETITSAFPGQDVISDKYIYAQYEYAMTWKTVRTYWGDHSLQNYLTTQFTNDVQTLTAADLVKKYGTHVLSQIKIGQKFDVYFQAKSTGNDTLHSSIVGLTYTLKKAFGLPTGYLDLLKANEVNAISEPKLVYESVGGDPSKITKTITSKGTQIDFFDWLPTCTENTAFFIDILPNGLTPLYDLIADPTKKAEVKGYITSYLEQNQVKI